MNKSVLILVLSSDFYPYSQMIEASRNTWDSFEVEGVETIFFCGTSEKENTDKVMYFDVGNGLFDMSKKNLAMFEWALANKEFDYVARVNASCYVDKKELIKHVQDLPNENLFAGVEAQSISGFTYLWGGCSFIISRDVIKKIVENKERWQHQYMEDEAISLLVSQLGVPFTGGNKSCSIDREAGGWLCISYCGKSINLIDFRDLKELGHTFYRVKNDSDRRVDEALMYELFKVLQ